MEKKANEMVFIQSKLNAPKKQRNTYGNYNYRSCEDILEAVKPLLAETECVLTIHDEIVQVADRIYVKATATLTTSTGKEYTTTAFAREAETKKGMDESQITGSASSYARKYALNGLFCIDDTKDSDATNTGDSNDEYSIAVKEIGKAKTLQELTDVYNSHASLHSNEEFMKVLEVNVVGTFLITKYLYKYMNNGVIVNISSTDAEDTYNEYISYLCADIAETQKLMKKEGVPDEKLPNTAFEYLS